MTSLPPTHLEFIERGRPHILDHLRIQVARHAAVGRPMTADEMSDVDFLTAEVIREIEVNLRRRGVDPSKLTREQILSAAPSGFKHATLLTLNYSYNMFFNFMLMGEHVYFADAKAVDAAANTAGPDSCNELRVPFKSCMLVLDDNLSRKYLYADPGTPVPSSGPVTIYLTEHVKEYGRLLAIVAVHQSGPDTIGMLIERSLALHDGGTVAEALATRWPEDTTSLKGGFANASHFIDGLGAVFIRLLCNLVSLASEDAAIETSSGKKASRFPFRRVTPSRVARAHRSGTAVSWDPMKEPDTQVEQYHPVYLRRVNRIMHDRRSGLEDRIKSRVEHGHRIGLNATETFNTMTGPFMKELWGDMDKIESDTRGSLSNRLWNNLLAFEATGSTVYDVSAVLEKLLSNDVGKLVPASLKLPRPFLYLHFGKHQVLQASRAMGTFVKGAYVTRVSDQGDDVFLISLIAFADDSADFHHLTWGEMLRRRTTAGFAALDVRVPLASQPLEDVIDGDPIVSENWSVISASLRAVFGALLYLARPNLIASAEDKSIDGVGTLKVYVCS
jgi:hypothetical protein